MINFLAKIFIKNSKNVEDHDVRHAYGVLCGGVGVVLNLILFGIKVFAGSISGSVAIVADAINNLSDAGSSVITMVGFKMAGRKPNPEHPFGHGRIEYVTGLIVSFLIILMGFELGESSLDKIINPESVDFAAISIVILIVSVGIKLYMYCYNKKTAELIKSQAMQATAMDSFTDSISTCVVLFCMLVSSYTGVQLDGWCGLLVALFILYTGITSAKDTISPLLGARPEKEFVDKIEQFAMSYEDIKGIHDLIVHDYGPGRMMISFHAEVPADGDILQLHDMIDNVEQKLRDILGCEAVIHMDPIVVNDETTTKMRTYVEGVVKGINESLTMHDFRMVEGPSHTNLIFDVVVPHDVKMSDDEVKDKICEKIEEIPGKYFAVIKIDKPFV